LASERVERRLTAVLAADVAGYSRLMSVDEEGTLAQLKAHRSALIDLKIAEHRGRIVKTTGDGMLVEFVSVIDALRCGIELQRGMQERNAAVPEAKKMEFRIGINVGDIIIDGDEIFGDGVNIAARLEALARPNGICISQAVHDQVEGKLELSMEDIGFQRLKNISSPVRVYRIDTSPGKSWRYVSPYRGLAAMEEEDSDYFFGRARETTEVLDALAASPNRLVVLIGNSGVGKSSLAQAGVIAALRRQAWPQYSSAPDGWPSRLADSGHWHFLTIRPSAEPVRSLVEVFLGPAPANQTHRAWASRCTERLDGLLTGKLTLSDLLDQTGDRHVDVQQTELSTYFLYIDQGEELYVRAEERQRRRFSELLAAELGDERLRAVMSLRADFFGELQKDEPLYDVSRKIDVPPLREAQLRELVSRPAALLGARFESDSLAANIAHRVAEDSTKDAGALPLLSYLLDDMWTRMVERGDGILRLPEGVVELGRVLVQRAEAFLARNPRAEDKLRRIFTFKLATVREDGEPMRRRSFRSEFSDEEWRLVSELAGDPNRLLAIATPEAGEPYAEVAHEAIFKRWDKLKEWIAAEREFLAWRSVLEAARRAWTATPKATKADALLMGAALTQARSWLAKRPEDLPEPDRAFIVKSQRATQQRTRRTQALIGGLVAVIVAGLAAYESQRPLKSAYFWLAYVRGHPLNVAAERLLKPGESFWECAKTNEKYSVYCPEMVVMPPGTFVMGSPEDEKGRSDDEGPQHEITIAHDFAVSRFVLTFDHWDACVRDGGCALPGAGASSWGREKQPAINVSWDDAQQYVSWLSALTGQPYRLLSEAEWEYVARAGTTTAYSFGNDPGMLGDYGWYSGNSGSQAHPVGEKKPNAFGLYDMHGNVWEWVEDCYHEDYNEAPANGSAWKQDADCGSRVVRGGSWGSDPEILRSASRFGNPAVGRYFTLGFRVARTLINP
jgi:formylglycine-generating enzyme required for sulfatase activity/class 3 adenylate cyclase